MRVFRVVSAVAGMFAISAGCAPKPTETNSQANTVGPAQTDFSSRFGIGVRTAARTCVAIRNHSVPPDGPVTVIQPQSPQTFNTGRILANTSETCPVSANVDSTLTSYQLSVPDVSTPAQKLVPFIVYVGPPASSNFAVNNNNVEADLEGNHSRDTFRACSAANATYLSVWHGSPLLGTLLWSGRYDDSGNAGGFPACDPKEL